MDRPDTYEASEAARKSVLSSYNGHGEKPDRYWLHILLFFATLAATTHAGGILVGRALAYETWGAWWFVPDGLIFAAGLLLFLGTHEFGHYLTARRHGVNVSLPYFIPLPFIGIGTLGAVIRIREPVPSLRVLFDIGVAGPLAGFVVAFSILVFAFATLPGPEAVFDLPGHDALKEYVEQHGAFPDDMPAEEGELVLMVGETLLYWLLSQFFPDVPPMWEMYHYPLLFAGWLGLFFTALNLLPVGQLDGGHILYALVGHKWHRRLARSFVVLLLASGTVGFVSELAPTFVDLHPSLGELSWFILAAILYFYLTRVFEGDLRMIAPTLGGLIVVGLLAQYVIPALQGIGYTGWFIWCLLIVFMIRIEHPPVLREEPLTTGRKVLAFVGMLIFVLCFSFRPLYIMS